MPDTDPYQGATLEWWRSQALHYHRRFMKLGLTVGGLEQENQSLQEQLNDKIEATDRPLWRRIINQRRALRAEIFWRKFFENEAREAKSLLTTEQHDELRRLRLSKYERKTDDTSSS